MASTTYQETVTTYGGTSGVDQPNQPQHQTEIGEKDNCVVGFAKCWLTIIGVSTMLFGLGLGAAAIYVKFFYADYGAFNQALTALGAAGFVWGLLGFGVVLAVCALLLVVAGCCHDSPKCAPIFKTILIVFTILLSLLLIAEVVVGAAVFISLNNLSVAPVGQAGTVAQRAINDARTQAFNTTYVKCCQDNTPPYNSTVIEVNDLCKWPELFPAGALESASAACPTATPASGVELEKCLCGDGAEQYGYVAGVFLSSNLSYIGIIAIVFAVLVLIALIAACVLICHALKGKKETYTPNDGRQ